MAILEAEIYGVISEIEAAIQTALGTTMKDGLLREIKKKAEENVYSYSATAWAMSSRRGMIGDLGNMDTEVGGGGGEYFLSITNITQLQHPGGADESDVVEGGWENYRQPGPRPFMQPALDEYVGSGRAEADLNSVLASYGLL